jgi:hypothetical protein
MAIDFPIKLNFIGNQLIFPLINIFYANENNTLNFEFTTKVFVMLIRNSIFFILMKTIHTNFKFTTKVFAVFVKNSSTLKK